MYGDFRTPYVPSQNISSGPHESSHASQTCVLVNAVNIELLRTNSVCVDEFASSCSIAFVFISSILHAMQLRGVHVCFQCVLLSCWIDCNNCWI